MKKKKENGYGLQERNPHLHIGISNNRTIRTMLKTMVLSGLLRSSNGGRGLIIGAIFLKFINVFLC